MSVPDVLLVLGAGLFAGLVNAIVGSGSLLTFPVLLAVGYSPIVANVSNTVGMAFGNVSGVVGYRRELSGQRSRMLGLGVYSLLGSLGGAILLLALPERVFHGVVPALVLLATVLVVVQPRLTALLEAHREHRYSAVALRAGVFLTAIYGGYFGAAQGVMLIGLMGLFLDEDLQRINALKNVLAAITNGMAALVFAIFAHVFWPVAALLAVSSVVGGQVGSAVGRRLAPGVLRGVIVAGGVAAVVKLLA